MEANRDLPSSERPVHVAGARRLFGSRVALAGVDLGVGPGEIVGLVGPNGSGKTTLLKLLAGFLRPDAGDVRIFGLEPRSARARVMERARFVFAPPALFESLTAIEHLHFLSGIRVKSMPRVDRRAIESALDAVGLLARAHDRVRTFSFGMRQRLALAQALLPMPSLLVLDEPTDGLDPLAILELRAVLRGLREQHGVSILLSSHLLVEIDRLVDRMLVLSEGATLFHGAPQELTGEARGIHLRVDDAARGLEALEAAGHAGHRGDDGEIRLDAGVLDLERAREILTAAGVVLRGFHEHRPSLEEALLDRLRQHRVRPGDQR